MWESWVESAAPGFSLAQPHSESKFSRSEISPSQVQVQQQRLLPFLPLPPPLARTTSDSDWHRAVRVAGTAGGSLHIKLAVTLSYCQPVQKTEKSQLVLPDGVMSTYCTCKSQGSWATAKSTAETRRSRVRVQPLSELAKG